MFTNPKYSDNQNWRRPVCLLSLALANVLVFGLPSGSAYGQEPAGLTHGGRKQVISISGNRLLRDGKIWVPHGLQIVAFVAPPAARKPPFTAAYEHFSVDELHAIRAWGADCVRFQVSQPGADPDPRNRLYDPDFVRQVVGAVKAARVIGLNVIVSIQDEEQSGETSPASLPNEATKRVWDRLAPQLNGDDGIIYEMINEPRLSPDPANWQLWAQAMNEVIRTIRATGATNTLLADGLNLASVLPSELHATERPSKKPLSVFFAETLHGAIPLKDHLQKVFYSTHPYFHNPAGQTRTAWMRKFGEFAARAPVIVGEWSTLTISNYYCKSDTPEAALEFLRYIHSLGIGLVAANYDFGLPQFGGVVSDYAGTPTTFANGIQCGAPGFGPGTLIQSWYRTGSVPDRLE